ncbi:putative quinol monooxygenase [Pelobacter seleniigenes]|uniref:putative quinol monooxygenase n=1 Tax=Pelobacter seleniigenes TaxID=407188 RepID=UPI0004A719FA|nr:putative quinol monooxygenase [Pelobacter seleniigenes]
MINVIASIQIKDGQKDRFLDIFKANVPNVLAENGCLEYVPTVDVDSGLPPQQRDSSIVTILEKWASLDDLKAHLVAPHMLAYREQVKDLVVQSSIKVLAAA